MPGTLALSVLWILTNGVAPCTSRLLNISTSPVPDADINRLSFDLPAVILFSAMEIVASPRDESLSSFTRKVPVTFAPLRVTLNLSSVLESSLTLKIISLLTPSVPSMYILALTSPPLAWKSIPGVFASLVLCSVMVAVACLMCNEVSGELTVPIPTCPSVSMIKSPVPAVTNFKFAFDPLEVISLVTISPAVTGPANTIPPVPLASIVMSALVSSELIVVLFRDSLSISTIPVPLANIFTSPLVSAFVRLPFDDVVAAKSV